LELEAKLLQGGEPTHSSRTGRLLRVPRPFLGPGPGSVEETALNGAQMKAMVEIAMQVQAGLLSRGAAIGILDLSFPSIPAERIARAIPEETEPVVVCRARS